MVLAAQLVALAVVQRALPVVPQPVPLAAPRLVQRLAQRHAGLVAVALAISNAIAISAAHRKSVVAHPGIADSLNS